MLSQQARGRKKCAQVERGRLQESEDECPESELDCLEPERHGVEKQLKRWTLGFGVNFGG